MLFPGSKYNWSNIELNHSLQNIPVETVVGSLSYLSIYLRSCFWLGSFLVHPRKSGRNSKLDHISGKEKSSPSKWMAAEWIACLDFVMNAIRFSAPGSLFQEGDCQHTRILLRNCKWSCLHLGSKKQMSHSLGKGRWSIWLWEDCKVEDTSVT